MPRSNNLAWLRAIRDGKGQEALPLIEEAIKAQGPSAALLDTRAVIYMSLGQGPPAVQDLEEAILSAENSAHYFHLARALLLCDNRERAISYWQKAKSMGLTPETVDPLERATYQQMVAQLDHK